nr:fructose-bisphosphate aldolase-like [Nomia melanderi]
MKRIGDKCYCKDKLLSPVTKYTELDPALCTELRKIADAILVPGKGLMACDESPTSLDERFDELGIGNTESQRRDYRQMLFTADQSQLTRYISGVVLHPETVYQKTTDGLNFVELLRQRNILSGVKVDKGLIDLFGAKNEKITEGLDSLQERCIQYKRDGCHFAKWRCTYTISETTPSQLAMITNANVLARFSSICQSVRLVPIIEPEILNDGDYGINKTLEVHEEVMSILFRTLNEHHVYLEGAILKPAMILSGIKNAANCTSQNAPMKIWGGQSENVERAQLALIERARLCSEASLGTLQLNGMCTRKSSKPTVT